MNSKKIISLIVAFIIAIVCGATFVYAATTSLQAQPDGGTGSGYYFPNVTAGEYSDVLGYTPGWNYGNLYDANAEGTHKGHSVFIANGKPIYCIEPGVLISLENIEYETNHQYDSAKHARVHSEEMAWISYFGYLSPATGVDHSSKTYYDATQQLVWQTVYPELEVVWYTDADNKLNSDTNCIAGKVQEIKNLIANAKEKPNITAPTNVVVGQTVTFAGDYSNYDVTLSKNSYATIVSQNSSGLKIKFNTTNAVTITVTKKFAGSNNINGVVYTSSTNQDLIALGLKLPTVSNSITVTPKGGNLEIVKTSSKPSGFLGNSTLEGAVYTVKYSGSGSYDDFELVTDENGIATTKGTKHDSILPVGTYTIKEKTASQGYNLDTQTYTVEITSSNYGTVQKVSSVEKLIQSKIQIVKVEASDKTGILNPEANKVFNIYPKFGNNQDTAIATLTTDADGYAISSDIPYGLYVLRQVEPYGTSEPIQPIEIEIDKNYDGKTLKYVLANAPYSARVKVVKRNKDDGKIITSVGFKFKIKWLEDENGNKIDEYITQTIILATGKKKTLEYFETDEDGTFITPQSLKPGKYQLEEISVADGYILASTPLDFEISPSTEGIELGDEYGTLLTIDFYNKKKIKKEEEEPNPSTSDSVLYIFIGTIAVVTIGTIAYKKLKY